MKPPSVLTLPSPDLIEQAVIEFRNQSDAGERAMEELFSTYPSNDNPNHVLWKVIVLNRIYSTQVLAVEDLSRHIVEHAADLDRLIRIGAPEAVDLFNNVALGNRRFNLFSFATKYCSWHNPEAYPIFDSRVGWYLWNLQKQKNYSDHFAKYEFHTYSQYKEVFLAFQRKFHLQDYSFKTLDKFLWLYGEPTTANQANTKPEPLMEPEPALIIDGVISDASLHAELLKNEPANLLADEMAREVGRELGFTEEELAKLILPSGGQ